MLEHHNINNRGVSVVVTVKDEEKTISDLLNALNHQTLEPDEIIVVDGGSKDRTPQILMEWGEKCPLVKVFLEENLNIAQGRNHGISNATNEIIALTDAGAIPDKNWIEMITRPFFKGDHVEVVGGWYKTQARDRFEDVVSVLNIPELKDVDPAEFLPSGRSIAINIEAWKRVGGYPEWLSRCGEDTLFGLLLKRSNISILFEPRAIVYWRPMRNVRKVFSQYLCYGRGDAEIGTFLTRFLKLMSLYGLVTCFFISGMLLQEKFLLFLSPILLFLCLSRHVLRVKDRLEGWLSCLLVYPIKMIMDLGLLSGHLDGYRRRLMGLTRRNDATRGHA